MGQNYSFSLDDCLIAEVGGVTSEALHFDVDAIFRAYEKIKVVAERLGVASPTPRLGAFSYPHVASLGAKIIFEGNNEPKPLTLISRPEEIDRLTEPEDYLAAPLIQKRLALCREIQKRCPQAPNFIGHPMEGPITTAALILGQDFLILPYEDPQRAHRLLEFSTRSAINYIKALNRYFGVEIKPTGFPDDFAGMFPPSVFREFVAPYWDQLYVEWQANYRSLHSELLRPAHLPFLKELKIDYFDPGVDQYLTAEVLSKDCPCKYRILIPSWQIHNLSAEELEILYRRLCSFRPSNITFTMERLEDEQKIVRLLKVAREMRE